MSDEKGFSRRSILKSGILAAGAGAVLSMATTKQAEAASAPADVPVAGEYDIVIVGAGVGGLTCAVHAAELGMKPIVIDKMSSSAGNSVFAGGILLGLHTRFQNAQKINMDDTEQQFYDDMIAVSQGRGDPVMTKYFVEHCTDAIQWLSDVVGIKWKPIVQEVYPARGRAHTVAGPMLPGGLQLSHQLRETAKAKGVPLVFNTKAVELTHDDELNVTGVKTLSEDGLAIYKAKYGVVLSTGGFHANNEMVTALMGGWAADMPIRGSHIITGENFSLVRPFFAKFVNSNQFHAGPIHGPTGANPSIMVNYGILVQPDGTRYIDEVNTYVRVAKETAKRVKNNWAFIIMDHAPRNIQTVDERFERYKRAKAPIYEGKTLDELAKAAGIDAAALKQTVKEYNAAVKKNKADQLTPPNTLKKPRLIEEAPFYAVPFQGGMTATFGGPLVNVKTEVLNTENETIKGLYAVGNAIGGLFYDDYIVGSQLTSATVYGFKCAEEIKKRVY